MLGYCTKLKIIKNHNFNNHFSNREIISCNNLSQLWTFFTSIKRGCIDLRSTDVLMEPYYRSFFASLKVLHI